MNSIRVIKEIELLQYSLTVFGRKINITALRRRYKKVRIKKGRWIFIKNLTKKLAAFKSTKINREYQARDFY